LEFFNEFYILHRNNIFYVYTRSVLARMEGLMMKIKKTPFLLSFALAAIIVVGQDGFAKGSDNGMENMMNGNGMMEAMNSPEGQKMMSACGNFMESYGDEKDTK
jgi:hypothetical protein